MADREFWLYFVRFLAPKLVGIGPDNPQDSLGPSFKPNRRFSTHFGPNLMFLDGTGTLVNQDWTWAEAWADLGLRPTLDDLGLRLGPILDRLWAHPLFEMSTSVLSQQMSAVETRQMLKSQIKGRPKVRPKSAQSQSKVGPRSAQASGQGRPRLASVQDRPRPQPKSNPG